MRDGFGASLAPPRNLPRPAPAQQGTARSRRVTALNTLIESCWDAGLKTRPDLDPATLLARAGLAAIAGRGHVVPLLEGLTASLATARLSPLGQTIAEYQLLAALNARRRALAMIAKHPEITETPITAPIIVLGQMRSGTTRVQRLLATDPRLDHTRFYESWRPVPSGRFDPRRLRAALGLAATRAVNPGMAAIHPSSAAGPDEEIGLLALSMASTQFEVQWRIPAFARQLESIDSGPVYAEFKAFLQLARWLRGSRADRPWVLKVPQFTQDLDALLDTFPDARLIAVDRDPVAVVASAASLVANQMALQSDAVDRRWIGAEWLRKVALRQAVVARVMAARQPALIATDYAAHDADWRREVGRLYAFLGLPLTPAVTARMADFLDATSTARRPPHRYSLAAFGLDAARVHAALAPSPRSSPSC